MRTAADDEREVARLDVEWAAGEQHLVRFGVDRERNTSFDGLGYSGDGYFQYLTVRPGRFLRNGGIVVWSCSARSMDMAVRGGLLSEVLMEISHGDSMNVLD